MNERLAETIAMLNSMPFAPIGPAPEPDAPPRRYVAPDAGRFTWEASARKVIEIYNSL